MSGAHVFIDASQFPANVRRDLLDSLYRRALNHKFHYESHKQAAKWLALHEAYSPARNDSSCVRIYDEAFRAATRSVEQRIHLIGLGCGGGQKEMRLLKQLRLKSANNLCTLVDVSLPLVLTARAAALEMTNDCHAIVSDLGTAEALGEAVDENDRGLPRILTLFGVIPNSEPAPLLSRIARLLRENDSLLISANLAPGSDCAAGVARVLPQYDNALTRDWLMTLLFDLGFEAPDGQLTFQIETDALGLHRIAAYFELCRERDIVVFGEQFHFKGGERIRAFFSYRHTVKTMRRLLQQNGITVGREWLNDSAEEGVFLCTKQSR